MNAVNSPAFINPNLPLVSTSRFEALSVSASTVAELLLPLDNRTARECYTKLSTYQPRLQADRLAAERALIALTSAKAEVRRINALSGTLIDTAVRVGRLFEFEEIADFANQDDAWLLSVEGLVSAFQARGDLGRHFAERFTQVLGEARVADTALALATAEYARATAAFSIEYRLLSAAIAVGRAVLAELGIEVPRLKAKKKVKAIDSDPSSAPVAAEPA